MIKLSEAQYAELKEFLGSEFDGLGDWAVVPSTSTIVHVINSKGTHLIRLSCKARNGKSLEPRRAVFTEDYGHYLMCNINNYTYKVHRLMAQTWLDNFDNNLTVNHKDGNKHNNDYHNLEMMTSVENVNYYHTSEAEREKRMQDYKYHGTTIKGRIHITNGVDSKMIYESDGIPEGWYKGRPKSLCDKLSESHKGVLPPNAGRVAITDGKATRYILKGTDIPEGWRFGATNYRSKEGQARIIEQMKVRKFITKDGINKRVLPHELASYLSEGWRVGLHTKRSKQK